MESLSRKFIAALAPARDHLHALALARAASPSHAETALLNAARAAFTQAAANPRLDIPAALEKILATTATQNSELRNQNSELSTQNSPLINTSTPVTLPPLPITPPPPMPADLWARLAAAIEHEAARSSNPGMLADDSVLLKPDPILAPRRKIHKSDQDLSAGAGVGTLTFILTALAVGIALTIFILTRPPAAPAKATPLPPPPPSSRP